MARLRSWTLSALGGTLLALGVVLVPLPGPGLLLAAAGLAVLAGEHEWAAQRVVAVRERAVAGARRGVRTHARAWASLVVCAALAGSGLLWVWDPERPVWWALPDWTWLPGGAWAGVSQLVSGLITLALVGWSYAQRLSGSGSMHP